MEDRHAARDRADLISSTHRAQPQAKRLDLLSPATSRLHICGTNVSDSLTMPTRRASIAGQVLGNRYGPALTVSPTSSAADRRQNASLQTNHQEGTHSVTCTTCGTRSCDFRFRGVGMRRNIESKLGRKHPADQRTDDRGPNRYPTKHNNHRPHSNRQSGDRSAPFNHPVGQQGQRDLCTPQRGAFRANDQKRQRTSARTPRERGVRA